MRDVLYLLYAGVRGLASCDETSPITVSSHAGRSFWRSDSRISRACTTDSEQRSLMSIDDMSDLMLALPVE